MKHTKEVVMTREDVGACLLYAGVMAVLATAEWWTAWLGGAP
jgi:hypothetical protein